LRQAVPYSRGPAVDSADVSLTPSPPVARRRRREPFRGERPPDDAPGRDPAVRETRDRARQNR